MTKLHLEYLEENPTRIRKFIALLTAYVWVICVALSYLLTYWDKDTIAILALVTAQFASVIGFYMFSNAKNDSHEHVIERLELKEEE